MNKDIQHEPAEETPPITDKYIEVQRRRLDRTWTEVMEVCHKNNVCSFVRAKDGRSAYVPHDGTEDRITYTHLAPDDGKPELVEEFWSLPDVE